MRKSWVDPTSWELPIKSIEFVEEAENRIKLKHALYMLDDREHIPVASKSYDVKQLPSKMMVEDSLGVEILEFKKSLRHGSDSGPSVNWFQRLSWAITKYKHDYENLTRQVYLAREIRDFHHCARIYATELIYFMTTESSTAAAYANFREIDPQRDSYAYTLHRPIFERDRVFVKDSIAITIIGGGRAGSLTSSTLAPISVSRLSAAKVYKNWVRGGALLSRSILQNMTEPYNSVWAGFCGVVDWIPICAFYEPLLAPLDDMLKVAPINLTRSREEFDIAVSSICGAENQLGEGEWLESIPSAFASDQLERISEPFAEWYKKICSALKLNTLPIGCSDLTNLICLEEHQELMTSDCSLIWHVIEGTKGYVFIRNLSEFLPPLCFSPTISALPEALAGPQVIELQRSHLHQCLKNWKLDPAGEKEIPQPILRRCPREVLRFNVTMVDPPRFPTFTLYCAASLRHEFLQVGSNILHSITTGLNEGWCGSPLTGEQFRSMIRAHGLRTRELCQLILVDTTGLFSTHLHDVAYRELSAKALKGYICANTSAKQIEYLSLCRPPELPGNYETTYVDHGGRICRPFDVDARSLLISHFMSSVGSIVDNLDRWIGDLESSLSNRPLHWWAENIGPDFAQLVLINLRSHYQLMPNQPEVINHAKCLMSACQRSTMAILLGLRAGVYITTGAASECNRHASTMAFIRRDACIQKLGPKLRDRTGDNFRGRCSKYLAPRVLVATGLDGMSSVRECDRSRYLHFRHQWQARSVSEYRSECCQINSPIQSIDFGNQTSHYAQRPLTMSLGGVSYLLAELRHRRWPCSPTCPEVKVENGKSKCGRWVKMRDSLELGMLASVLGLSQSDNTSSSSAQYMLEYAYGALAHGDVDVAYQCALRLVRDESASMKVVKQSRHLMFEISCSPSVEMEYCAKGHHLITSMISDQQLSGPGVLKTEFITELSLNTLSVDQQIDLCLNKSVLARRIIQHLSLPENSRKYQLLRSWCNTLWQILRDVMNMLEGCRSATAELTPLYLTAYRLRMKHSRALLQIWPSGMHLDGVNRAFAEYLFKMRDASSVSDDVFGSDVYYHCSIRATEEHQLSDYVRADVYSVQPDINLLCATMVSNNVSRASFDNDKSLAELSWLASRLIEKSCGPLHLLSISAMILAGDDLVHRSLAKVAGMFSDKLESFDNWNDDELRAEARVNSVSVEHLFSAGYYPRADSSLRAFQLCLNSLWYDDTRTKLLDCAVRNCYTPAYFRLLLLLKNTRAYSLTTFIKPLELDSTKLFRPSKPADEAQAALYLLHGFGEDEVIKAIRNVTWNTLCAKAVSLSETIETSLIARWLAQMRSLDHRAVHIITDSNRGSVMRRSGPLSNQSFIQEEYQNLKEYLSSPLPATEKDRIIDQCLSWCDASQNPRISNYIMDRNHTPAKWFDDIIVMGGSTHSANNDTPEQLLVCVFDIIRASHSTNTMKAKWLVLYLSSLVGLRQTSSAYSQTMKPEEVQGIAVFNKWIATGSNNLRSNTSQNSLEPQFPALDRPIRLRR